MAKKSRSGSQKSTPRNTPQKASPKVTPKGNAKASPKASPRAGPKASPKATPSGTPTKRGKPIKAVSKDLSPVPRARILHSLEQLIKFVASKEVDEGSLLGEDESTKDVQLIAVNNKSFTDSTKNFKIKLLNIKHSIFKPWKEASATSTKDFKILLILKDSDVNKVSADDFLGDKTEGESSYPPVEIICGNDLKTKYKAFEKRRAFVSEFSLVLADDNIITTLPKLLGSKAYDKVETTPISIKTYSKKQFSKTTLINQFKKTYTEKLPVRLPRGTTLNVHLGNLEWFKPNALTDNVELIIKELIDHYKIRSIFIKTPTSPVLPLYYNQDVLDELSETKTDEAKEQQEFVEIDGFQVQLSSFDKSLMEIVEPEEWPTVFAKQIDSAKRKHSDDQLEAVKKAKN